MTVGLAESKKTVKAAGCGRQVKKSPKGGVMENQVITVERSTARDFLGFLPGQLGGLVILIVTQPISLSVNISRTNDCV